MLLVNGLACSRSRIWISRLYTPSSNVRQTVKSNLRSSSTTTRRLVLFASVLTLEGMQESRPRPKWRWLESLYNFNHIRQLHSLRNLPRDPPDGVSRPYSYFESSCNEMSDHSITLGQGAPLTLDCL